jgi:hypothetical protein
MDFPFTCYLAGGPNLATPWNRKCLQVSYLTGGVGLGSVLWLYSGFERLAMPRRIVGTRFA